MMQNLLSTTHPHQGNAGRVFLSWSCSETARVVDKHEAIKDPTCLFCEIRIYAFKVHLQMKVRVEADVLSPSEYVERWVDWYGNIVRVNGINCGLENSKWVLLILIVTLDLWD